MKSLIVVFSLIVSLTLVSNTSENLNLIESSAIESNDPCGCAADFLQCRRDNPGYQGLINCMWDYDQCVLACPS